VSETTRVAWYRVVHCILPTNEHLHRINRTPTDICRKCDDVDAIRQRLTACGEGRSIWEWTKKGIAHMLRTLPDCIPDEWLKHPQFKLWPSTRRHVVLWLLAQLIIFLALQNRDLTLEHFLDFLQRTRWKMYRTARETASVGNYFTVIDAAYVSKHNETMDINCLLPNLDCTRRGKL